MYFVIMGCVALIMIGIGISQLKSRKPVGFYTGVKPPEEKELRDVEAWNKKHGVMWILYGSSIVGCGFVHMMTGISGGNDILTLLVEIGVMIGGIFVMMWYHVRLEKTYRY